MEIGPYTIERELGRGGMGAVYLGRVRGDPDAVAIKVIHASLADDPDLLARFEREGQVLERLAHPNLVALRARGTYSGGLWLAMDYVEGESLEERLKRGPLSSPAARQLLISLCEGITSAHAGGVLHRDLKPANVLLRVPDAHPLIVDFGIALPLDVSQHLTQTGEILGSPGYLAPEQCGLGASPSSETDVYGLGAVLYAALTGEAPIQGPTLLGTLDKVLHAPPRPPRELVPGVDPALERVCLRCLAKEPQERYSDSSELARALREEHAPARRARAWIPLGLVAALGALGLIGAYLAWGGAPEPLNSAGSVPSSTAPPTGTSTGTPTPPSLEPARSATAARVEGALTEGAWAKGHAMLGGVATVDAAWLRYRLLAAELEVRAEADLSWHERRSNALDLAERAPEANEETARGRWARGVVALTASLSDPFAGERQDPSTLYQTRQGLEAALELSEDRTAPQLLALRRMSALTAVRYALATEGSASSLEDAKGAIRRWGELAGCPRWERLFSEARLLSFSDPNAAIQTLDDLEAAALEDNHPWARYAAAALRIRLIGPGIQDRADLILLTSFLVESKSAPRLARVGAALLLAKIMILKRAPKEALQLLDEHPIAKTRVGPRLREEHTFVSALGALDTSDPETTLQLTDRLARSGNSTDRLTLLSAIALLHLGRLQPARTKLASLKGQVGWKKYPLYLRALTLAGSPRQLRVACEKLDSAPSVVVELEALKILERSLEVQGPTGERLVQNPVPIETRIRSLRVRLARDAETGVRRLIEEGRWVQALRVTYDYILSQPGRPQARLATRLMYAALLRGRGDVDALSRPWSIPHALALRKAKASLGDSALGRGLVALLESVKPVEPSQFPRLKAALAQALREKPGWSELHEGHFRLIESWRSLADAPPELEFEARRAARSWGRAFPKDGRATLARASFGPRVARYERLTTLLSTLSTKPQTSLAPKLFRRRLKLRLADHSLTPIVVARRLSALGTSPHFLQRRRREVFLEAAEAWLASPGDAFRALATLERLDAWCGEPPLQLSARYHLAYARAYAELGDARARERAQQAWEALQPNAPPELRALVGAVFGRLELQQDPLRESSGRRRLREALRLAPTQAVWLESARASSGEYQLQSYREALRVPCAAGVAEQILDEIERGPSYDVVALVRESLRYLEARREGDGGVGLARVLFERRGDAAAALLLWEAFLAHCQAEPARLAQAPPDLRRELDKAKGLLEREEQDVVTASQQLIESRATPGEVSLKTVTQNLDLLQRAAGEIPPVQADRLQVPLAEYAALSDLRNLGPRGAELYFPRAMDGLTAWRKRGTAPFLILSRLAHCAAERGNFDHAASLIRAGLATEAARLYASVRAGYQLDLAAHLNHAGLEDQALTAIGDCLEASNDDLERAVVLRLRGEILRRRHLLPAARLALEQARELCPQAKYVPSAFMEIEVSNALLLVEEGEVERAGEVLARVRGLLSRLGGARLLAKAKAVEARVALARPESRGSALELSQAALALYPRHYEALLAHALVLRARGQHREALAFAKRHAESSKFVPRDRALLKALVKRLSEQD